MESCLSNSLPSVPINGKNVSVDFVYEMFDGVGEFIEHINKKHFHIVGYWHGHLIEVDWQWWDNKIAFAFVDLHDNCHTEEDEEKLIDYIKGVISYKVGLSVEVRRKIDGWILFELYCSKC